jgi:hypothetical protein
MPTEYSITLSAEAQGVLRTLKTAPDAMMVKIAAAMDLENLLTVGHVQEKYLSFPSDGPTSPIGLRHKLGQLKRTADSSAAVIRGQTVSSGIGASVVYAAAHEFGADIPAHTIKAKNAQALKFTLGGRTIYRRSVNIPAFSLPARRPFARAVGDRLNDYAEAMSAAVVGSISA